MMAGKKKGMLSLITVLFWITLEGLMLALEEVKMEMMAEEQLIDPSQEHTPNDLANRDAAHHDQVKCNAAGRMQDTSAALPAFNLAHVHSQLLKKEEEGSQRYLRLRTIQTRITTPELEHDLQKLMLTTRPATAVAKTDVTTKVSSNVLATTKTNTDPDGVTTVPNTVLTTSAKATMIPDVLTTTIPVTDVPTPSFSQLVTPPALRSKTTPISKLRSVTTKPPVRTTTPTGGVAMNSGSTTATSGSSLVCNLIRGGHNELDETGYKTIPKPSFWPIRPRSGGNTGPNYPRASRPLPIDDRLWDVAIQNS
ncbi:uncharacterized protein [Nothobranchius furzeri]|uniref:uncharacterized protein isoform X1 n=1 Tax=Nothobranchius furzeri TaxID=105023 RepID=UPI003904A638